MAIKVLYITSYPTVYITLFFIRYCSLKSLDRIQPNLHIIFYKK
ncbi:hypothetical protein BAZSYMA_ACONTIG41858_1 [Bathymodiolus azoricus thioautotrophic gill symbiont]|uniref:Uncharacterized protein n=1 Tax=Bathymodiolus azoricus thioautotrophic gill symbiont TaxID=235205 RepID=A0A1H6LXX5_9GAMM|nr:hypothetical protein BAZSYMA_ACONTIG41858_1 [Bathymodiolus azoricus thioautotrophic gill symbiont]